MKTTLGIEGIHIKASIGVYEWEKLEGRDFFIDIYLDFDLDFQKLDDDLSNTINYEVINKIVKEAMKGSYDLVETIPNLLYKNIIKEFSFIDSVKIKVRKLRPIKDEALDSVFVEVIFVNQ